MQDKANVNASKSLTSEDIAKCDRNEMEVTLKVAPGKG